MRLIYDTSVAAKTCIPENDSAKAIQVWEDFQKGLHELLSPDIFPAELAHLLTRAERQKRIKVGDAEGLWNSIMLNPPRLVPYLPLAQRALEISSLHRVGFYDCLMLSLSEREGCEFLTADTRIASLKAHFSILLLADL